MRKEIIDTLFCPICREKSSSFKYFIDEQDCVEIKNGKVICQGCKSEFPIKEGIIDFLINPRQDIISEQKGWIVLAKQNGTYERERIEKLGLKLPEIKQLQSQDFREHWLPHVINFYHSLKILRLKGYEKVLDLGAGRCWTTKTFAQLGCQAVAFDILQDKVMGLGISNEIINENLFFERAMGDMERLPFRNESFDVVFSTASIHHSDIGKSISEASRVLKRSGRLVLINEPTAQANDIRLTNLKNEEIEAGIAEHVYSIEDYYSTTRKCGITSTLYYPPGAAFMIRKILEHPNDQNHLKRTKLLASIGLKTKIVNNKTLPLLWRSSRLKPFFGLFLIGTKTK